MSEKKVKKAEIVTWELASVDTNHYLRVVVSSPYETIRHEGQPNEKKIELAMDFSDGDEDKVHLTTSLFLVSKIDGTETLVPNPGPSLVIDDIGKPPGACQNEDEEKEFAAPYSGTGSAKY
jgi:hypothetical protein